VIKFNTGVTSFGRWSGALFSALLLFGFGMQPGYAAGSGAGRAEQPLVVDFAALPDTEIPVSGSAIGGVLLGGVRVVTSAFTPPAKCWNLPGFGLRFKSAEGDHELILAPPAGHRSALIEFVGVAGKVTVYGIGADSSPGKDVPAGDSTVEVSWDGLAAPGALLNVHGEKDAKFTLRKLTLK
jgi:hypothetical protein